MICPSVHSQSVKQSLFSGQFDLHLNIFEATPTTFSVQSIGNGWIKELKAKILRNPGKAPVIIPAVIAGNECAGKKISLPETCLHIPYMH